MPPMPTRPSGSHGGRGAVHRPGIVTLALVSHLGPLPEPAKSLEMLQRHQAKRSEFGGELCQRDNAFGKLGQGSLHKGPTLMEPLAGDTPGTQ